MKLQECVALVTGGNRGIGEALVRGLLAAGAGRVYVGTRDRANAAALVSEAPDRLVAVRLDVTDPEQIAAAARTCADISLLINNAGAFCNETLLRAPDLSAARLEMETNYFGPLMMCRAFAPLLARHPESGIANVLSVGGIVAAPVMGGYSPSKFAGRAMCACLRAELAPQNTSVTALIVGSVDTRMASHVEGFKEAPATIAKAALKAIARGVDEVDTDFLAIDVRASLARDPRALELAMRRALTADRINTGR
jgi:NAD(P)-dependent dehydrogenase (short-subunit alcohol dehydrogenase family)